MFIPMAYGVLRVEEKAPSYVVSLVKLEVFLL
jgi:hypothetical protein